MSAQWEKAYLTLALPKGRLFGDSLKALESAKIDCSILAGESSDDRKLVFHDPENALRFLVARSQDVPTYVQFGAADLGIVGRDVLDEGEFDVSELKDLGFGSCTVVVAGTEDKKGTWERQGLRVATKYPNLTRRLFSRKGLQVGIVPLSGSVEIAPLLGIADVIVDLCATGETLKANGLVVLEKVGVSSARLIANKAALTFKNRRIQDLRENLCERRASS